MLPPMLEIIIVWHPQDERGALIAQEFLDHFHGTAFSGLIGGAIEVYVRSAGWRSEDDAPRPIPFASFVHPAGVGSPRYVVVVPLMGNELAMAVQEGGPWREYMEAISVTGKGSAQVGVFPHSLDESATDGTRLGELMGSFQRIAAATPQPDDCERALRCRELTQGVAQMLAESAEQRLTIFISHTKRPSAGEGESVKPLIAAVRDVIASTRLAEFFDAQDLQPGRDWDVELRRRASTSALLAIRTDLYPSREWCQREMLIAKREGLPVVILDAIGDGEERGSFLMDHVPRMPLRRVDGQWSRADIYRGLDLMVDQCLKRELWRHQSQTTESSLGLNVAWWAPHAPEPVTLIKWLQEYIKQPAQGGDQDDLIVLHPDPPLGAEEKRVLQEIVDLSGLKRTIVVMTPRLLAARTS